MDEENLQEEIFTVARDLYERTGRIEGRDLDNWLEAERLVNTLWKIAGSDGKKYIQINVPVMRYAGTGENESEVADSRKKVCTKSQRLNKREK